MLRILTRLVPLLWVFACNSFADNQAALAQTRKALDAAASLQQPVPIDFQAVNKNKSKELSHSQQVMKSLSQQQPVLPTVPKIDLLSIPSPKVDMNNLLKKSENLMNHIERQPKRYESQILVFVSSSMPDKTVRNYLQQTTRIDAAIVYRGLINNSMKDMRVYLSKILGDQPEDNNQSNDKKPTILIDPTLFDRFNIHQVPVTVVTESEIQPCRSSDCPTPVYHSVSGDVTLPWALSLVSRQIDSATLKGTLRPLIKTLRTN